MRATSIGILTRARDVVAGTPILPIAVVATGAFLWMAGDEGGFNTTTFLPVGILLVCLLGLALAVLPAPTASKPALLAIGLLAGYAVWSYLSITWAGEKGIAWDGANRTLVYAAVFALFALWPMRAKPAMLLLGIYALGVGVIGAFEIFRALDAPSAIAYFNEGRFSEPTGYANANVALWFSAFLPCLVLAGRRELTAPLRGAFLGFAGVLLALSILGQSRSWFFVLPAVIVLLVVLVPGRGRTIAAMAVVAAGLALTIHPMLDVYESFDPRLATRAFFEEGARAALLLGAGLFVVGTALALVDRSVTVAPGRARSLNTAAIAAVIAVGVAGVVAFAVVKGNPIRVASDQWSSFKRGGDEPRFSGSRLGSAGGTYRYDFWRVAWRNFTEHPIGGVGADNFGRQYLVHGTSDQTPSYPHSVELRALSQTGVVGTLLLAGALLSAFLAALPAVRRNGTLEGAMAGIGLTVFAYFIVHGSLDWLWEFAGLGAPAFAMLGLACSLAAPVRSAEQVAERPRRPVLVLRGAALLAFVLAITILVVPWIAARDVERARAIGLSNPTAAIDQLNRAAQLNRLSPDPDTTAGLIDARLGNYSAAREHFKASLDRDDGNSLVYVQLAAIASVQDRPRVARPLAARAVALNPKDAVARTVNRRIRRGHLINPLQVNTLIRRNLDERIGPG